MKSKITILAFLITFSMGAYAQESSLDSTSHSSVKYRAELGYGQLYRYGNYTVKSPYNVIRGGVNVEYPLKYGLRIESGLKYSYAFGNREQYYLAGDTAFASYNGHLLDVPLRITYTLPIFWGFKIFGYAGPNFNIGLLQSEKRHNVIRTRKDDQPEPTYLPEPGTYSLYNSELRRINIQFGAGGGLQWKSYRLRSGYDWGINNISKDKNKPERMRGWHVAFEYEF